LHRGREGFLHRLLGDVDVTEDADEDRDRPTVLRTEYAFVLPRGYVDAAGMVHRDGVMRLATARDEISPQRDPRVRENEAYLTVILLSRVVTRLGSVEPINPAVIEGMFATRPAEDCLAVLAGAGVPAGKVRTLDDVYGWEQTRSQGLVIEVDHATQGILELPGPTIRFDDNGYAGGRAEHQPPPLLGQHNESVRAWLDEDAAVRLMRHLGPERNRRSVASAWSGNTPRPSGRTTGWGNRRQAQASSRSGATPATSTIRRKKAPSRNPMATRRRRPSSPARPASRPGRSTRPVSAPSRRSRRYPHHTAQAARGMAAAVVRYRVRWLLWAQATGTNQ
jgi:hypothetical protein